MKQYDIGIDLGTTSIIIATEEQGVVFRQPTIGAVDTRTNTIIAVGDEALQMVGRVPAYIDLVRPLRDGVIQDHRMTNDLIVRFVNEVPTAAWSWTSAAAPPTLPSSAWVAV